MATETELDTIAAALANSARRKIVAHLAKGEATVNELAQPSELSLPAISKHIKVLEQAGIVTRTRRAQFRPCALNPAALEEINTWLEQCITTWSARLDRMDTYLVHLQTNKEGNT